MKFDNEIVKDFIIEKDPTVKRKNIIFENVYLHNECKNWDYENKKGMV
jgi:hypothetical protein